MPNKRASSNAYFSFDVGPAHIISFSSEAYFWQVWEVERQFEWLKADLAAVNRSVTPWVITMAHRPMYCSNSDNDDCTKADANSKLVHTRTANNASYGRTHAQQASIGMARHSHRHVLHHTHIFFIFLPKPHHSPSSLLWTVRKGLPVLGARFFALEPLFQRHGVDLAFWAHEHSYERLWPTYDSIVHNGSSPGKPYTNPGATVHVVTGAAGCREGHDSYHGPRGPWSAMRSDAYGYGKLFLANGTHLRWEQLEDTAGKVIDSFWLVKTTGLRKKRPVGEMGRTPVGIDEERVQAAVWEQTARCVDKQARLPSCALPGDLSGREL